VPDSLRRFTPPPLIGSIDRSLHLPAILSDSTRAWLPYAGLPDLLEEAPGVFLRNQAGPGQYTAPVFHGADWRSISFSLDGRPLNNPMSGVFNLWLPAAEPAARIEVITGPRAVLTGRPGGAINLVTANPDNNRAYTHLRYVQTADVTEFSDVAYSQNISRRMNVSAGMEYQGTAGRFLSSTHSHWGFRGKIRYSLLDRLHVIVSEDYTSTQTDLNGGVDISRTGAGRAFSTITAVMVNTDAYEKVNRHDAAITLAGSLLPDSTDISMLSIYGMSNLREYRDEENRFIQGYIRNGFERVWNERSSTMGALFRQDVTLGAQKLSLGATFERDHVGTLPQLSGRDLSHAAMWGKDELTIGDLTLALFARMDRSRGRTVGGLGADIRVQAGQAVLFGGVSYSGRAPTLLEESWEDSTIDRPGAVGTERHTLIEGGFELTFAPRTQARLAVFHRVIDSPILLEPFGPGKPFPGLRILNAGRRRISGGDLSLRLGIWRLVLEGTPSFLLTATSGGGDDLLLPRAYGRGGFYFEDDLLSGNLGLKVGVRGRFQSAQRGELFSAELPAYVRNLGVSTGAFATVDAVAVAHIGDAYVQFLWENLTNTEYFLTPYYPGRDRTIRFGIAWEFRD
jgi:outer membrane cobalamin receptor